MRFRRKNKYGNIKVNGYDSSKEAKRAIQLRLMERQGYIKELEEQVKFRLVDSFKDNLGKTEKGVGYIADFTYYDIESKRMICEDVKSVITRKNPTYILKRKLFKLKYPQYTFLET